MSWRAAATISAAARGADEPLRIDTGLIAGKRVELAGKIQESYGLTKDEVEVQIKQFEQQSQDERRKSDA